jgi:hypothetical protein
MTIARSVGALLGTNESTGVTIAAAATGTGTEVDLLSTTGKGRVSLYLCFTPASIPARGFLKAALAPARVTGSPFADKNRVWRVEVGAMPASAQKVFLGTVEALRYALGTVLNSSDVSMGNVALLYELEKET